MERLTSYSFDGDHTYWGVKTDFEQYSQLVSEGGVIALHNIVDNPENQYDVPKFWQELQSEYRTEEIVADPNQSPDGIGVVWIE